MKAAGKNLRIDGRWLRIARLDAEKYEFLHAPEEAIRDLRGARERIDLFTFLQPLSQPEPRHPYVLEWDNLAVLPVSTFDEWWRGQINNKTRNMVRRAERQGLTVGEAPFDDHLVSGIRELYNETRVRQGKKFAHYGKDLAAVREMSATYLDASVFIVARFEGGLVGFAKLVMDDRAEQAGLMHFLASVQHRDKSTANALVAASVRACADRGIRHLVYSNFAYGSKLQDSLSDFKTHNGFRRVDLPRYYVPLTKAGALALRLRLHHRLADHVPDAVLRPVRRLRLFWHERSTRMREAV